MLSSVVTTKKQRKLLLKLHDDWLSPVGLYGTTRHSLRVVEVEEFFGSSPDVQGLAVEQSE